VGGGEEGDIRFVVAAESGGGGGGDVVLDMREE
jgi:hypothetical protein